MNKQRLLQLLLLLISFCGFVVSLAPFVGILPATYQKYAVVVIGFCVSLDRLLVSTNQILVGPAKIQGTAVQQQLAALPDKSGAIVDGDAEPTSSSSIDTTKPPGTAPRITS